MGHLCWRLPSCCNLLSSCSPGRIAYGVCRTDTIFLASCYYGDLEAGDGVVGCDVSHRGGPPGFVHISGPGTLRFADYIGNFTFTTLGESLISLQPENSGSCMLAYQALAEDELRVSSKSDLAESMPKGSLKYLPCGKKRKGKPVRMQAKL